MELLSIFALNTLFTIGIVGVLTFIFAMAKKHKFAYYNELKMALLLVGMSLREDKLKQIATLALEIVKAVEPIELTPQDKKAVAIAKLSKKISEILQIEIDETALNLIIDIAVSTLPPTNKQ